MYVEDFWEGGVFVAGARPIAEFMAGFGGGGGDGDGVAGGVGSRSGTSFYC